MTSIAVGCGLMTVGVLPYGEDISQPPLQARSITAAMAPAASRLYDGQSIQDMADFSAMTGAGNFVSAGAGIAEVTVIPTGDAVSRDAALIEGAQAGFSVVVTDDTGYSRTFETASVVVEYHTRVLKTGANEAMVDINPLVPDEEIVPITISGGTGYDGLYEPTAGALRGPGPYAFAGTVRVGHDGAVGDLVEGSVLIHDGGLWCTPTETLTLSMQARSDGVDIPGATGPTHVLAAETLGTAYTLTVTADDGVAITTVTSSPIAIPAVATSALTALRLHDPDIYIPDFGRGSFVDAGVDLGGAAEGDMLAVCVCTRDALNNFWTTGVSVGGTPATRAAASDDVAGRVNTSIWVLPRPAGAIADIAATFSEDVGEVKLTVFAIPGATAVLDAVGSGAAGVPSIDLNLETRAGGVLIVAAADDGSTGEFGFMTVANASCFTTADNRTMGSAFETVASDETSRVVSIVNASNTHMSGAAVSLI